MLCAVHHFKVARAALTIASSLRWLTCLISCLVSIYIRNFIHTASLWFLCINDPLIRTLRSTHMHAYTHTHTKTHRMWLLCVLRRNCAVSTTQLCERFVCVCSWIRLRGVYCLPRVWRQVDRQCRLCAVYKHTHTYTQTHERMRTARRVLMWTVRLHFMCAHTSSAVRWVIHIRENN